MAIELTPRAATSFPRGAVTPRPEETMPSTTRNIHFGNETTITTEQTESERNETTLVALSSLVGSREAREAIR